MQIVHDMQVLRSATLLMRAKQQSIALVPTMGALHAGHMALVTAAKRIADHVIVSIFVNPIQFGPNEDFASYPRSQEADAAKLVQAGVALLWVPSVETVYPARYDTHVRVAELSKKYCGATRSGHFEGVATLVAKLFNQVQPDHALFGEKDWQQLAIIRRMVCDLDFPISIHGVAIVRESDGLALSSRNAYLTPVERKAAACFPASLRRAAQAIASGQNVTESLKTARRAILKAGFERIDYVALIDGETLEEIEALGKSYARRKVARILAAAHIGKTRLIDNLAIG